MHRRVETIPKQQLAELRRAYERHAALAEQLKDGVNSAIVAELYRALARDAYRIAAAYKKSVANSCARMEDGHPSEGGITCFACLATGLTLIVAIIPGGAFTITLRPKLFRFVLPVGAEFTITTNGKIAATERRATLRVLQRHHRPVQKDSTAPALHDIEFHHQFGLAPGNVV